MGRAWRSYATVRDPDVRTACETYTDFVHQRLGNGELGALRQQIAAFQQTIRTTGTLVKHRALPGRFHSIQNASQKLHEALCKAWCCDDLAHRGHYAKLCLDADVQTEVRLDLAISCHEMAANGNDV
jgi:hypothetical protein